MSSSSDDSARPDYGPPYTGQNVKDTPELKDNQKNSVQFECRAKSAPDPAIGCIEIAITTAPVSMSLCGRAVSVSVNYRLMASFP